MLSQIDSGRFAQLLAQIQSDIRAARNDVALLDVLGARLSRLATEIGVAVEHAFSLVAEVAA